MGKQDTTHSIGGKHSAGTIVALSLAALLFLASPGRPQETAHAPGFWPHFLGPNYDKVSGETGLLRAWPADGPRLLWRYDDCGEGQSAVTVAQGLIYSAGDSGDGLCP